MLGFNLVVWDEMVPFKFYLGMISLIMPGNGNLWLILGRDQYEPKVGEIWEFLGMNEIFGWIPQTGCWEVFNGDF